MLTELSIGIQGLTQATIGKIQWVKSYVKSIDVKVNFFGRILGHDIPNTTASQQSSRTHFSLKVVWIASLLLCVRGQKSAPVPKQFELSSLDGTNGFILNGKVANELSGYSVSSAGDVNGDGLADILIGALHELTSGTRAQAKSYVLFGSKSISKIVGNGGTFELSSLNGSNGLILIGEAEDSESNISVSSAGDVNGDGLGDLLIGTSYASLIGKPYAGKSYVVFGSHNFSSIVGDEGSLQLSSLKGARGFILNGEESYDNSGASVSSAGDLNGDGLADILIGAITANPKGRSRAGKSYIVFGSISFSRLVDSGGVLELSSLNGTNGIILDGETANDFFGRSVSSAGDVNGDGLADLVIGAFRASPIGRMQAGKSYVLYGSRSFSRVVNSNGSFDLSSINGSNGFILNGEAANDLSGASVSSAGDVNGDGLADIVIGAHQATPSGKSSAGKSYVLYGSRNFSRFLDNGNSLELSRLYGDIGFILNGEAANDKCGYSVSSAGDVNGDGLADLVIGAFRASASGNSNAGKSYVLFGSREFNSLVGSGDYIALSSLNGTNGFILNGEASGDYCGRSVSSAGDVNGDGVTDLLIGAYSASPSGKTRAGKTYVVFGRKLSQTISTKSAFLTPFIQTTTLSRTQQNEQIKTTVTTQLPDIYSSSLLSTISSTPSSLDPLTQSTMFSLTTSLLKSSDYTALSNQLTSDTQSLVLPIVMVSIGAICLTGIVVAVVVIKKCKNPEQEDDNKVNKTLPFAHTKESNGIYDKITIIPNYDSGDLNPDEYDSVRSIPLESNTMKESQNDYIEIQLSDRVSHDVKAF